MKTLNTNERIDSILLQHNAELKHGLNIAHGSASKQSASAIKQLIIDILAEASPEYRTDTRGVTQNPNNVFNHTKKAQDYNECIDDFTDNLIDILDN